MFEKAHSHTHEKPGLRVIIVGAGKVGRTLVDQLTKEGNDVTIVDKSH
jgi:trk system potassium uptake protein